MLRPFPLARRKSAKRLASSFALAIALAGGAIAGSAAFAPAAYAQEYSDAFVEAYQPVADVVNAADGDTDSVRGQFPSIVSLIQTPDDRFAAGNLLLLAGNELSDPALQRQGLELQLESGKVPPESVAQYQWFVGNLAFQMEDYAEARTAIQAAIDAGWTQDDPHGLLAESYFQTGDTQGGVDVVLQAAREREAAGTEVPQNWLLRALQAAYDNDLAAQANTLSLMLVRHQPSDQNWTNALQVVGAVNEFTPAAQLDLLRLMRAADVMSNRNEFVTYIEAADPRIMANEVQGVLSEGIASGEFTADDEYVLEVQRVVDTRATQDREEAPELVAEAEASASGQAALDAGDVLYSLEDFAEAERLYLMAAEKGADSATALTRAGIAQVRQGKYAEAQSTFEQVSGERETIAQLWSEYAAQQAG